MAVSIKVPVSAQFRFAPFLAGVLGLLAGSGCTTPQPVSQTGNGASPDQAAAARPTVGTPMQDVRTEATIQEMENWYIAEKNSQPTRQHLAEKKKREKEQAQQKQAQEQQQAEQGAPKPEAAKTEPGS